ncbi:hypothetical protein BGW80DRAFT_1159894, partial [Lactifluus volemus]
HITHLPEEAWVLELLAGYLERIYYKLSIYHHIFDEFISELQSMGHQQSKYVSLEGQLIIFLY